MFQASLYSRLDVVRLLLQEGAEANVVDEDGTTALMLASMPLVSACDETFRPKTYYRHVLLDVFEYIYTHTHSLQ